MKPKMIYRHVPLDGIKLDAIADASRSLARLDHERRQAYS